MLFTSSHANVRQLAALMAAHGVTRCVLCPGSRNAPVTAELDARSDMACRRATDERSAGFAALGWAAQAGAPVAVCVTSGSALLNLHPAVAEAFYRHLPLLVISADRPPAAIGQQEGQCLPQPGVFGALVNSSVTLPEHDAAHANRLINEALLALRRQGGGPAHINVPLSEPLFGTIEDKGEAAPRLIRHTQLASAREGDFAELARRISACPRRLILLGQLPAAPLFPPALTERQRYAVVGEHLCNAGSVAQTQPDSLLGESFLSDDAWTPDLLITCGGCLVSKKLKRLLRARPPKEHWHVSREGALIDTFGCLTRIIEGDPDEFWKFLSSCGKPGDAAYAARWRRRADPFPVSGFSGQALVGSLMGALPCGCVLHLANSSAVRYAQLFPLRPDVHVECNRGVNGIEGSLSAALGYAMGDERVNMVVIGDLSFFYDMNALWLPGTRGNVRALLLNNGAGGIFSTLPGIPASSAVHGPHSARAEGWARSMGWRYRCVRSEEDWPVALAELTAPVDADGAPLLVEAMTGTPLDASATQAPTPSPASFNHA